MGEAITLRMQFSCKSNKRNRIYPGQTLHIPNFRTSIWPVVLRNQVCKAAGTEIYDITASVIFGTASGCGTRATTNVFAEVSETANCGRATALG